MSADTIVVVGGGPAGAFAAEKLASNGRRVVVFDPRGPWEKPCGGGVTTRALARYPFLLDASAPKQTVERITLVGPGRRRLSLDFDRPFVIYARTSLNGRLLERAREAGAEVVGDAVVG